MYVYCRLLRIPLIVVLLVAAIAQPASAQQFSWASQNTRGTGATYGSSIATDAAGNSFVVGGFDKRLHIGDSTFVADDYYNDIYFAKYDSTGKLSWVHRIGCPTQDAARVVGVDGEGSSYIAGSFSGVISFGDTTLLAGPAFSPEHVYLAKYSTSGKRMWLKHILMGIHSTWLGGSKVDANGNVCLALGGNTWDGSNFSVLSRYDKNGKALPGIPIPSAVDFAFGPAGELYLSGIIMGRVIFGNKIFLGDFSSFVCKYNADGSLAWATHVKGTDPVQSFGIGIDSDGNSYITGNFWGTFVVGKDTVREVGSTPSATGHDVFVAKFDASGHGLWAMRGGNRAVARHGTVLVDRDNSVYVSGGLYGPGTFGDKELQGGNFIARLDPFGKVVWVKEAPGLYHGGCAFSKGPTGTIYLTGSVQGTADFDGKQIASDPNLVNHSVSFLAALRDTVPLIRPNVARGVVYNDGNGNCRLDPGESPMPEVIVKATPGDYYALTDANGRYTHYLPPGAGQYTFSQIVPSLKASVVTPQCPVAKTYTVTFEKTGEVRDELHFGNQVTSWPLLAVQIGAGRRRRCFRGETAVKYSNEGWAPAVGVQVKVVYPEYVVPISSSVPWTKRQGDTLFFNIGTLPGNTKGVITLTDSVSCGDESIRGLTQCVRAFITPRNNAGPPDPQWDRSSLELTARCRNNGFVRLVIRNVGTASMTDSTGYRIFLDAQRAFAARCQLGRNDSLVLEVPANGRTVRLEADQRPGHPMPRQPSITIEGCGGTAPAQVSKGYVDQLPQDEADPETSVSCLPILDSFDPNDKQASPAGVTASRLIGERQEIEYLVRFQNTGTDVAYKVVIADTLSPHLDPATLRIGAASHPFTWKVSGAGAPVITWTFDPINLPDSTSNEPGSHGFVRFRVAQRPGNPHGTVIANQAHITFDYNAPIATNQVVHTVGEVPVSAVAARVVYCDGSLPSTARAGETIMVHDGATARLGAARPQQGIGRWRLVSGKATLADEGDPGTTVTDLGVGKNVLEWSVTLCDQVSVSRVTVERVVIPAAPVAQSPAPCCAGDALLPLRAAGQGIAWFADAGLEHLLGQGELYQPATARTDTFYVTQTVHGYRSSAQTVVVTVRPVPAVPIVPEKVHYCRPDQPVVLRAEGQNVRWYRDAALTQGVGEGAALPVTPSAGAQYFVTQRLDGCQSKPAVLTLHPGVADPKSVFIANVITPNGDHANEAFRRPTVDPGTCIGAFRQVQIYNRWGKLVYESSDEHFAWNGGDHPSGLYYYTLRYSGYAYTGALSVLR